MLIIYASFAIIIFYYIIVISMFLLKLSQMLLYTSIMEMILMSIAILSLLYCFISSISQNQIDSPHHLYLSSITHCQLLTSFMIKNNILYSAHPLMSKRLSLIESCLIQYLKNLTCSSSLLMLIYCFFIDKNLQIISILIHSDFLLSCKSILNILMLIISRYILMLFCRFVKVYH